MPRRLPPLPALRVFEAAGRLGSFKRAAAELNVTPSAVSHNIIKLERVLGVDLFVRETRRLVLTPAGADYLGDVAEALALIASGTRRLPRPDAHRVITVSCAPTLASRWLLPRLPHFLRRRPGLDIAVDTSRRHVGVPVDGFDFAIRMSRASVADPSWRRLFGEALVPVCSTNYRAAVIDGRGRLDLGRATLVHVTTVSEDWDTWTRAKGGDAGAAAGRLRFDTIQLALDAARSGLGVALGRKPLVDDDLTAGALVALDAPLAIRTQYWLVGAERPGGRDDLRAFERWLIEEAERFEREAGPAEVR